jgi:hypothetical protein
LRKSREVRLVGVVGVVGVPIEAESPSSVV